jgi:hypothetical protein
VSRCLFNQATRLTTLLSAHCSWMRQQRFKVSRDPVVKKTAQDNYTAWKEGPYGKVRRKLSRLWQCPCSLTNTEQLHIA